MEEPITVTGGTGLLGAAVVRRLRAAGRPVRVLSRRPAPPGREAEWATADLGTGAGVAAAVAGSAAVVHCATSARRGREVVLARTLVDAAGQAAEAAGRPPHLLYVSIV